MSPQLQTGLEAQAISEGLLTRSDYCYGKLYDFPSVYGATGTDRRILIYLCLFPSIEVTQSDFLLKGLSDRAGLAIRTIEPRSARKLNMCGGEDQKMSSSQYDALAETCHVDVLRICLAQRERLINLIEGQIAREASSTLFTGESRIADIKHVCRPSFLPAIELLTGWYGADLSATPFQGLGFEIELADGTMIPKSISNHPYFELWLDKIDDLYVRLFATLFYSRLKEQSFATGGWWSRAPKLIDGERALDAAHMVTIKFRDELRIVPDPSCISEAVDMGNSKEMRRLLEKVSEWIDCANADQLHLESRIRADIFKASKELRRLKRYKEFTDSPLIFGTKMVLGQIPIVSNILSVVEGGSWVYEKWVANRTCWVSIDK